MAIVSVRERPRGVLERCAAVVSRRRFGRTVQPLQAAWLHHGVLVAMGVLEGAVDRGWHRLDPPLRRLAVQAAATSIGCTWCTDFGYWENVQAGLDPAKVRDVPHWQDSPAYDDRERAVLEFATCATATPVVVPEDLVVRLHALFDDAEIVELAAWVALESFRSRFNAGLGLTSDGFRLDCAV